ncbi:MAG: replication-associated recombination protein A [Oscillospiraceae bacterium]|nr:replication-associated recombination protein A [Oscillospiraceae bacterium]
MSMPLAAAIRPKELTDVCGQKHLLAEDSVFRRAIEKGVVHNMIFYGPSGVGKTTVASIIAAKTGKKLFRLNGTQSSTSDIKDIIAQINTFGTENGILLYLDEIQYLNKKQQQSLLEVMEDGSVTLIASTTENPYFAIFNAILSRSTVFEFKPLSAADVKEGIAKAMHRFEEENGTKILISDEAMTTLSYGCGGDMRKCFNALELLIAAAKQTVDGLEITDSMAKQVTQRSSNRFDNSGDVHYNLLSALQKSIRGSDENAALHYLCRLLDGDGLISAVRRLQIIACEDIGLAYPQAIPIVKACCDIALSTGMPEARIPLSDAVILLATAPKSNSGEAAGDAAMADVKSGNYSDVPAHLKDANAPENKQLDVSKRYKYPHSYPNHWVQQQYLPDAIRDRVYYVHGENKTEQAAKAYWEKIKK